MKKSEEAALDEARVRHDNNADGIITLSTGIRARLKPVSASLVDAVTTRIPDPVVPMWHNEDKGRDEPNPNDPAYNEELKKAGHDRGIAAVDACIIFGVELVDPIPEDDTWVTKLKFLGIEFNERDEFERELAYKKYVAVGSLDLNAIMQLSGVPQAEVNRQIKVSES